MKMSINIVQSIYTIYRKTIVFPSILGKFVPKIVLFLRNIREFDNKWSFCYTMYSFNKTESQMSNSKYSLEDVAGELSNIEQAILAPNKNSFGESIGDELHGIQWKLERIAEALEIIAKKMSQ